MTMLFSSWVWRGPQRCETCALPARQRWEADHAPVPPAGLTLPILPDTGLTLQPHQLRDIFSLVDADGNGMLSVEELHSHVLAEDAPAPGRPLPAGERVLTEGQKNAQMFLQLLFKEFRGANFKVHDTDGSGTISYAESEPGLRVVQ